MSLFDDLKRNLSEASGQLRLFTLGGRGATPDYGEEVIERMRGLCERLKSKFASGKHAKEAAAAIAAVRGQILAAEARLALLRRRGPVPKRSSANHHRDAEV
jgi:hypothetical protein